MYPNQPLICQFEEHTAQIHWQQNIGIKKDKRATWTSQIQFEG